jgi:hypothetical protein
LGLAAVQVLKMFADEVRQKIEKLRAMDPELRLFAADHHRYEFIRRWQK